MHVKAITPLNVDIHVDVSFQEQFVANAPQDRSDEDTYADAVHKYHIEQKFDKRKYPDPEDNGETRSVIVNN